MKIFISEIDRENARNVALKNIARYFNIRDWEFKSNDELKNEIDNLHNTEAYSIIQLLNDYFTAYDQWFNFYKKRKAIEVNPETEYELSDIEQRTLQELINERENTLDRLQREFDGLQLRRFNRNHFGADLTGIIK